ncbi:MAG TPA: hypothetical protein VM533_14880 [Fimbriiglobus sp.]|jgi:hypothetical protein|nr:hypothetical protein [Fimbriiglobus sp.]
MSPAQPSDPSDDLGYEVVDDPGYEVVDAPPVRPPAAPPARPIPAARILPAKPLPAAKLAPRPAADPGFEVVEDATPSRPKARQVHDAETVEVPRAKAKTVRVRAIEEEEEEDRPRKKRKKPRHGAVAPREEKESSAVAEWAPPVFMMVIGVILTVVGTYGHAKGADAAIAPVAAVAIRVVGEMIAIPITIVALMVIGSVFGIEYGTFTHAVRSLAAMGFLISGLMDVFGWVGLPFFVYQPIVFMIGLGLFMTLLRLDVWEAIVTMFGLNVLSWVFQFIMLIVIVAMLSSGVDPDDFGGGSKSKDSQGQVDDEDLDPDDRQRNRGNGGGRPIDPDDE